MARLIDADFDFAAYERETNLKVKVRAASVFVPELCAHFAQPDGILPREPCMSSTKLRDVLHFRSGEVTAWAGYNGHRKSLFAGQVALDLAAMEQRVLIASMEMAPERTLARMARQAAGIRCPDAGWLKSFARWSDDRLWLFDHLGRVSPKTCIAMCRYFAAEFKGQHVLIDSMMMVCSSEESLDEQKQFITDLCRLAIETEMHVHLVVHCRKPSGPRGEDEKPSKYDIRGAAAISDQVSNVITVWANRAKRDRLAKNWNDPGAQNEPDALIGVEKQRNGSWEGKVSLWFDEKSLRFCDDRTSVVHPMALGVAG